MKRSQINGFARRAVIFTAAVGSLAGIVGISVTSASAAYPTGTSLTACSEFADDAGNAGRSYCTEIGMRSDIHDHCKDRRRLLAEEVSPFAGASDCTKSVARDWADRKCFKRSSFNLVQSGEESGPTVMGACFKGDDGKEFRDLRTDRCFKN